MKLAQSIHKEIETDETNGRMKALANQATRSFPSATGKYFLDKVPIVQWLPRYSPKWILNDFIAGVTIGVLLIPQALAYAKIATIPGEFGLMSSWLPPAIYAIMGTSKGTCSKLKQPSRW